MDWLYRGHRIGVGAVKISKAKCIIRASVAGTTYSFSFVSCVNRIKGIVIASIRGREWVCDLCMRNNASISGSRDMRDAINAFFGFTPNAVKVTYGIVMCSSVSVILHLPLHIFGWIIVILCFCSVFSVF